MALGRSVGCRITNADKLDVIEGNIQAKKGGSKAFFQVIINPWAWGEALPARIYLLNVDWPGEAPVNKPEGRYRLDPELTWEWDQEPNLAKWWTECALPLLAESVEQVRFRKTPRGTGAYNLFFPHGVNNEIDELEDWAGKYGFELVSAEQSRKEDLIAAAEGERGGLEMESKKSEMISRAHKAKSEGELDVIEKESEALPEDIAKQVSEAIEGRRAELVFDFDGMQVTKDHMLSKPRRRRGIRKWEW